MDAVFGEGMHAFGLCAQSFIDTSLDAREEELDNRSINSESTSLLPGTPTNRHVISDRSGGLDSNKGFWERLFNKRKGTSSGRYTPIASTD